MTAWVSIIASAASILALGLGWWIAGAKKRKAKRERDVMDKLDQARVDRDADSAADVLSDLGLRANPHRNDREP